MNRDTTHPVQVARINFAAEPGPRLVLRAGRFAVAVPGSAPGRWRIVSSHETITEALRCLGRERGR